jgi:hypothetical protein
MACQLVTQTYFRRDEYAFQQKKLKLILPRQSKTERYDTQHNNNIPNDIQHKHSRYNNEVLSPTK